MAGLSDAVLIVEAKEKSGTMITARLALDYNKELLTIPASIFSEYSNNFFRVSFKIFIFDSCKYILYSYINFQLIIPINNIITSKNILWNSNKLFIFHIKKYIDKIIISNNIQKIRKDILFITNSIYRTSRNCILYIFFF